MNVSKLKLLIKYLFGGFDSVVEYLLDIVNRALKSLTPVTKERIAAARNVVSAVLSTLDAFQWLCPTRWQHAYVSTIVAVQDTLSALSDYEITQDELAKLAPAFKDAVAAWRSDDDPKVDVDFSMLED